ncbi:MAG: T9SS type A sorting domain-containing protein, partial [Saprospiraceae bacterium]|nr:T9SS type A sorting domain-containing protein [Saprospiraceae bacterium]
VSISGVPDTVTANASYTITLTNASNAARAGFQLTCLDNANAMCGTLTAGAGVNIGSGAAQKKYARQSSPKLLSNGTASWSFTWKAPATASGNKATFYFVSLCANNNGQKTGDNVLVSTKPIVFQTTSASAEPKQEAAVSFFPTLVQQNVIQINLLEDEKGRLQIFDNQGKIVLEQVLAKDNTVNTNPLPKGLYTALIETEGKKAVKKFIVQ